jgi:RNA-splicing ligase RtcB
MTGVRLNELNDTIVHSVWSAFEKLATEFPGDAGVKLTLQYHHWYSAQRAHLSLQPATPTTSTRT